MDIFMVRIVVVDTLKEKVLDTEFHGAFKTYRKASEWLINEGFEPYLNDEMSEFLEEETISFIFVDKENNEEHHADIDSYMLHD